MPPGPGPLKPFGRTDHSDEALRRAAFALDSRRPQDAERIASGLLSHNPGNIRALLILGQALLAQDRAQDAVAPLETAARGQHDPEIDTQLAIALRRVGRREEALARLGRATKRRPPYAAAFQELGYLLAAMERYPEAIDMLNRALQLAPMAPQLSIQLGYVFLNVRNFTGAKTSFARALSIVPDAPDALFGIAKAHQALREFADAAKYYRRSLARSPNDESAWINLGHCLLELRQLDAGYECFRNAARVEPKHSGRILASLIISRRGRFWLKPSHAMKFLCGNATSALARGTDDDKHRLSD